MAKRRGSRPETPLVGRYLLIEPISPTNVVSPFIFPTKHQKAARGMSVVELDDKGRITIPKRIRTSLKIGRKVLIINAGDHVKIIPLPEDPFEALEGAFSVEKPFSELRREAEALAEEEALGG